MQQDLRRWINAGESNMPRPLTDLVPRFDP
jgi:hypothetical protein